MGRIHLLPTLVQNQIAAGEVVERPVSVLKELVENSIDAGATALSIFLEEGGMTRLAVEDNGVGMDSEDAALALVRHATSKIKDIEDLQHIVSMGFRGEALASIASVSRLTLRTRTKEAAAAIILESDGETHTIKVGSGPVGTLVDVRDLFYNVPARQKYLRSAKTEITYCLRYITEVSLLHPEIRFTVEHNGKQVLNFPASSQEERLVAAMGKDFLMTHLPISLEHPDLQIRGYISKPHLQLTSRNKQFLFVNKRPVRSDIIQKAVTSAYHRIVDEGRYASVVLFVDVHPTLVDVNVHPRKLEVRFHDPQFLFSSTEHSIKQALTATGHERQVQDIQMMRSNQAPMGFNPLTKAVSPYASTHTNKSVAAHPQQHMADILSAAPFTLRSQQPSTTPTFNTASQLPTDIKVLGQLMTCYILVETAEGLMLIDQHAAHERVLFDRLTRDLHQKNSHVQQLLTPHMLHLTPQDASALEVHAPLLQEAGFHVDQLDPQTWTLQTIPQDLSRADVDLDTTFHTMLNECEDISVGCGSKLMTDYREKLLAYTACRSAVKFGDLLSQEDMERLVTDLFATERRYTCPHGRTSIVHLDKSHLKRLFDR